MIKKIMTAVLIFVIIGMVSLLVFMSTFSLFETVLEIKASYYYSPNEIIEIYYVDSGATSSGSIQVRYTDKNNIKKPLKVFSGYSELCFFQATKDSIKVVVGSCDPGAYKDSCVIKVNEFME